MHKDEIDRVWEIVQQVRICMLTTMAHNKLRSRPMHALPNRESGCLWFVTDCKSPKQDEINAAPSVCLSFADTSSNTYLSIAGNAEIIHDASKAAELWSPEAQAWWPKGPTDPDIRVMRVILDHAEYWDSRGNDVVVALKLAVARLSGTPPDLEGAKTVKFP